MNINNFFGGRQILDTTMITKKLVDDLIYRRREGVHCKLDMKKAYDHVNWGFDNLYS